jgi:DNA-binding CsgD family transcriptional regulator
MGETPVRSYHMPELTARERDVTDQLIMGKTNKEIAAAIGCSYETVKEHVQHVLRKFNVKNRELVIVALMRERLAAEGIGAERLAEISRVTSEVQTKCKELQGLLIPVRQNGVAKNPSVSSRKVATKKAGRKRRLAK